MPGIVRPGAAPHMRFPCPEAKAKPRTVHPKLGDRLNQFLRLTVRSQIKGDMNYFVSVGGDRGPLLSSPRFFDSATSARGWGGRSTIWKEAARPLLPSMVAGNS